MPSTGKRWLSPDVWNRLADDGQTDHQSPEFGQENYLYVRVHNKLDQLVVHTNVDVWLAPASTGLAWPNSFAFVGRISVPKLGPNETRVVGPVKWDPPPPSPSDHFCFYIRAMSMQDPITFVETSSVNENTKQSNNIAWRNVNIVDIASSKSTTFLMRHVGKRPADVDLEISVPQDFLDKGKVYLSLKPHVLNRWPKDRRKTDGLNALVDLSKFSIERKDDQSLPVPVRSHARFEVTKPQVTLRGFRLMPGQAVPVILTVASEVKEKQTWNVEVIQKVNRTVAGGILYVVRTGHARK